MSAPPHWWQFFYLRSIVVRQQKQIEGLKEAIRRAEKANVKYKGEIKHLNGVLDDAYAVIAPAKGQDVGPNGMVRVISGVLLVLEREFNRRR